MTPHGYRKGFNITETKERLARSRGKRGSYRGVCTKISKETDELISATEIDYDRCEIIRSLLEEKWKILTEIDGEILGICEVEDIQNEIEKSAEYMK